MLAKEEIDRKILELNSKLDKIRSRSNNPRDPQLMYIKGIIEGMEIIYGRKLV